MVVSRDEDRLARLKKQEPVEEELPDDLDKGSLNMALSSSTLLVL